MPAPKKPTASRGNGRPEANKPTNVLVNAYEAYIVVKRCYEARRGYLAVHVSEPEMAHAKDAIQLIEKRLAPQLPSDTSVKQLWARADQGVQQRFGELLAYASELRVGEGLCQSHKMQLSQILRKLYSESSGTQKDF